MTTEPNDGGGWHYQVKAGWPVRRKLVADYTERLSEMARSLNLDIVDLGLPQSVIDHIDAVAWRLAELVIDKSEAALIDEAHSCLYQNESLPHPDDLASPIASAVVDKMWRDFAADDQSIEAMIAAAELRTLDDLDEILGGDRAHDAHVRDRIRRWRDGHHVGTAEPPAGEATADHAALRERMKQWGGDRVELHVAGSPPSATDTRNEATRQSDDAYFGTCPQCGKSDGFMNDGADHWGVCVAHGVKWYVGSNLFSGWRDEPEEQRERNRARLATLTDCSPGRANGRLRGSKPVLAEILRQIASETGASVTYTPKPDDLPF